MNRYAWFIDAGYVYAAGGTLCFNTRNRGDLELHFETFTAALLAIARQHHDENGVALEHLRTYWYDGAINGIPSPSHLAVSRMPGVKLRLGTLNREGQQKGVDTLAVRDLIKLSNEKGIATAFVLSGDEDLRQGIAEAQDTGVKVVLVGIEPAFQNQSELLVREADACIELKAESIQGHLTRRPDVFAEAQDADAPTQDGEYAPAFVQAMSPSEIASVADDIGQRVAASYRSSAQPEEVARLVTMRRNNPSYPIEREIDRELLFAGRPHFGARIDEGIRRDMRTAFWTALLNEAPAGTNGAPAGDSPDGS